MPQSISLIERHNKWFAYLNILINLFMAGYLFKLWYAPSSEQISGIVTIATLMAFEFI